MKSQRPCAKGWQLARVVAPPVEARTWAKNRRARTCSQRLFRFSSDQAGRTSRNSPGSSRSPYQPRPQPSPWAPVFASAAWSDCRTAQGMRWRANKVGQEDGFALVGKEAAHRAKPSERRGRAAAHQGFQGPGKRTLNDSPRRRAALSTILLEAEQNCGLDRAAARTVVETPLRPSRDPRGGERHACRFARSSAS